MRNILSCLSLWSLYVSIAYVSLYRFSLNTLSHAYFCRLPYKSRFLFLKLYLILSSRSYINRLDFFGTYFLKLDMQTSVTLWLLFNWEIILYGLTIIQPLRIWCEVILCNTIPLYYCDLLYSSDSFWCAALCPTFFHFVHTVSKFKSTCEMYVVGTQNSGRRRENKTEVSVPIYTVRSKRRQIQWPNFIWIIDTSTDSLVL